MSEDQTCPGPVASSSGRAGPGGWPARGVPRPAGLVVAGRDGAGAVPLRRGMTVRVVAVADTAPGADVSTGARGGPAVGDLGDVPAAVVGGPADLAFAVGQHHHLPEPVVDPGGRAQRGRWAHRGQVPGRVVAVAGAVTVAVRAGAHLPGPSTAADPRLTLVAVDRRDPTGARRWGDRADQTHPVIGRGGGLALGVGQAVVQVCRPRDRGAGWAGLSAGGVAEAGPTPAHARRVRAHAAGVTTRGGPRGPGAGLQPGRGALRERPGRRPHVQRDHGLNAQGPSVFEVLLDPGVLVVGVTVTPTSPGARLRCNHLALFDMADPQRAAKTAIGMGCGPGRASLTLAAAGLDVLAVDTDEPFLRELSAASASAGLSDRDPRVVEVASVMLACQAAIGSVAYRSSTSK